MIGTAMSVPFGPYRPSLRPRSPDDVSVFFWDGREAVLSEPVSLTDDGSIQFAVEEIGKYKIRVTRYPDISNDSVVISEGASYDPSDLRSYIDHKTSQGGSGGGGVSDHGNLTGLGDDDHPQYFNQVRGDSRYARNSVISVAMAAKADMAFVETELAGKADSSHTHSVDELEISGTRSDTKFLRGDGTWATPVGTGDPGSGGGVTAHGDLTGLTEDDHPQYLNEDRADAIYVRGEAFSQSMGGMGDQLNSMYTAIGDAQIAADNAQGAAGVAQGIAESASSNASTALEELQGKAALEHTHIATDISDLNSAIDDRVSGIIGAAPAALDTLDELAAALGDDPDFAATITSQLAGKADTGHTHTISNITNLQSTLDGKAASAHTHAQSDISGLSTALSGKANTSHTHAISDISLLQSALDGKAGTSHTHSASDITDFNTAADSRIAAQRGVVSGIASLDTSTKIPIAQIPTGTTSTTVALGNHTHGTTAVSAGGTGRTTSTTAYGIIAAGTTATGVHQTISPGTAGQFLKSNGASALGSFSNIAITDVTNLQAALNDKAAATHGHAISDVSGLQSALDGKAATSHTHTVSNVTGLQSALDAKSSYTGPIVVPVFPDANGDLPASRPSGLPAGSTVLISGITEAQLPSWGQDNDVAVFIEGA